MPRGLDDARQQAFIDQYENLLNTMGADEAVVFIDANSSDPSGKAGPLLGPQGRRRRGGADDGP